MIPGVNHLVRQRVFEVAAVAHLIGADEDTMFRAEATALTNDAAVLSDARGAAAAEHIGLVKLPVERRHLVAQEPDYGRVLEEVGPIRLTPRAVARLVRLVPILAVVLNPLRRDLAGDNLEVVHPPLEGGVVTCPGGVIFEEAWKWTGVVCLILLLLIWLTGRVFSRAGGGGGGKRRGWWWMWCGHDRCYWKLLQRGEAVSV